MNSRARSTIISLPLNMRMRPVAVTSATCVDSTFSSRHSSMKRSISLRSTTTAMRSCDSLMASSVELRPLYLTGTRSRYMSRPSASSPMATLTPPAPKSFDFFIRRVTSRRRNSRASLRSSGALPFCTSEPHSSSEFSLCSFDEPVAPPMPSRPVRPPSSRITSPAAGASRRTSSALTAPTTAPISRRLAT